MDHAIAVLVQGMQAGHVVAVVPQLAIGRVFDEVNRLPPRPPPRDLDQLPPPGERGGKSRRVVVVRNEVNGLHAGQFAGRVPAIQFFLQCLGAHALGVDFHAHRPRTTLAKVAMKTK